MNKIVYFFILLILFNQFMSQDDQQPEQDTTDECSGKSQEQCTLILVENTLIQCSWDENNGSGQCKVGQKYTTCASASSLAAATKEQCVVLSHGTNAICIKGTAGCSEISNCVDAVGENIEKNMCDNLIVSLEGGKCYYDGAKCTQAASCQTVADTSLTGTDLENLCKKFNENTKNCIPDGKKCKIDDKGSSTGGDDKDNEKENDKEGDGEKEKEGEKDDGKTGTNNAKNSSQSLNFSLVLLFLIFVI